MFDLVMPDGSNSIVLRSGQSLATVLQYLKLCATGEGDDLSASQLQLKQTQVDQYAAALLGINALIQAQTVIHVTDLSPNGYTPLYFPSAIKLIGANLKPTGYDSYMANATHIDLPTIFTSVQTTLLSIKQLSIPKKDATMTAEGFLGTDGTVSIIQFTKKPDSDPWLVPQKVQPDADPNLDAD